MADYSNGKTRAGRRHARSKMKMKAQLLSEKEKEKKRKHRAAAEGEHAADSSTPTLQHGAAKRLHVDADRSQDRLLNEFDALSAPAGPPLSPGPSLPQAGLPPQFHPKGDRRGRTI